MTIAKNGSIIIINSKTLTHNFYIKFYFHYATQLATVYVKNVTKLTIDCRIFKKA